MAPYDVSHSDSDSEQLQACVWYGNVSAKNKIKLARVVNTASKLIGNEQKHLPSIYNAALKRQILYDPTHPLNDAFQKLPSGKRLKVPLAKKKLFKKLFTPSPILILNAKYLCTVYFFYSIHLFPCTDLSNVIYLPILVHIINVTTLCLIKEPFKENYLLIYLFSYYLEYLFIYLSYLPYQF